MSTVIKVENLSKRSPLGVINRDMLYKDLQSRWAKFRGKENPNAVEASLV
jgi:lipopolysaccharide transport system ATP-binding protein